MAELTAERLRELVDYDPETGVFTRRVNRGTRGRAGSVAGSPNESGYVSFMIDGRRYLAHRLARFWLRGEWTPPSSGN